MSGRAAGLKVVTKAGGFGMRGSMRQMVEYLTRGGAMEYALAGRKHI
jgi:hypothetical protein